MSSKIVFFDLETGGLEARPTIMSRQQWRALERYERGPKPASALSFAYEYDAGIVEPSFPGDTTDHDWVYCPGNPIIQIAAIACDAETLEPTEEFEVKLMFRPELANPESLAGNSYDEETWKREAQTYPGGLSAFCAFLDRHKTVEMISERTGNPYRVAQLAGHNAASFDLDFILRSCQDPLWQRYALPGDRLRTQPPRGLFFPGSFQVLDTLHLARWVFGWRRQDHWPVDGGDNMEAFDDPPSGAPKNLKLETLAEHFEIDPGEAHDALADVRTTRKIASILREAVGL